ncbi:hypothetical protein Zm00014a_007737 [Zea mays]|uniref:Uncharacterized protein n=1 Tax=Zea mays TaxID=4577 RepID=A0A3L6GCX9_MAIZE|nr:hypothetical protein Zm00014a_007737 [Zea mays]
MRWPGASLPAPPASPPCAGVASCPRGSRSNPRASDARAHNPDTSPTPEQQQLPTRHAGAAASQPRGRAPSRRPIACVGGYRRGGLDTRAVQQAPAAAFTASCAGNLPASSGGGEAKRWGGRGVGSRLRRERGDAGVDHAGKQLWRPRPPRSAGGRRRGPVAALPEAAGPSGGQLRQQRGRKRPTMGRRRLLGILGSARVALREYART